jgi:hypothetical protein
VTAVSASLPSDLGFDPRVPPAWAKDLVIYELNPRTFTSPDGIGDGDGSGTFASLAERLPYLSDLGVNALWLAGFSSSTRHFYGISSVYACADPSRLDPRLGTEDEFRDLVARAHDHGIRIMLDVISHGVVRESALVAEHPDWFPTSSWGMADYDYTNPGFRDWWVRVWSRYATEFGVDGFRIDVDIADITVWDEIVTGLHAMGKEVVVFPENGRYHFSQTDWFLQTDKVRESGHRQYGGNDIGLACVQVSCHDNGWLGLPGNHYSVRGSRARFAYGALLTPHVPLFFAGEEFDAEPCFLPSLRQDLFGQAGPGGWLYGSRLDWSQLEGPQHAAMLDDVRTMLRLRNQYRRMINADPTSHVFDIVPNDGALRQVPYVMAIPGQEAVVVLANDTSRTVTTRLLLPLALLGLREDGLRVFDAAKGYALECDGAVVDVTIGPDGTPGGGYALLHVTGIPGSVG